MSTHSYGKRSMVLLPRIQPRLHPNEDELELLDSQYSSRAFNYNSSLRSGRMRLWTDGPGLISPGSAHSLSFSSEQQSSNLPTPPLSPQPSPSLSNDLGPSTSYSSPPLPPKKRELLRTRTLNRESSKVILVPETSQSRKRSASPEKKPTSSKKIATGKRDDSSQRFKCSRCGRDYSSSSNLSRHMQTHHSINGPKAMQCDVCNALYVSKAAFAMHILIHDKKYSCPTCDKNFPRKWCLDQHMFVHTKEKPHECVVCGKGFADKSNCRAHLLTHSDEKAHECSKCHKRFGQKPYLKKHQIICLKKSE